MVRLEELAGGGMFEKVRGKESAAESESKSKGEKGDTEGGRGDKEVFIVLERNPGSGEDGEDQIKVEE